MFHRNIRWWVRSSDPTHRKSQVSSNKMLSGEFLLPYPNFLPTVRTSDERRFYIYPVNRCSNPNTIPHRRPHLFPLPIVAIWCFGHGILKLGGPLDSPSIGDSDPNLRSSDPRGKSQWYAFKSSRSPIYQCARS